MGRLVQRLERRRAPDALVDAAAQRSEIVGQAPAIHTAEPARPPEEVVPRRPFFLQQRFRLSIPDLLLPIRSKVARSEERRVGKECTSRRTRYEYNQRT